MTSTFIGGIGKKATCTVVFVLRQIVIVIVKTQRSYNKSWKFNLPVFRRVFILNYSNTRGFRLYCIIYIYVICSQLECFFSNNKLFPLVIQLTVLTFMLAKLVRIINTVSRVQVKQKSRKCQLRYTNRSMQ